MITNQYINKALKVKIDELPEYPKFLEGIRRAPKRNFVLNKEEVKLALRNALRYVPERFHKTLAGEFLEELYTYGRIYAYRFRPEGRIYAKPLEEYEASTLEGKAFQVMIDNNLDFETALYPYELVTYGETGQVFQNWLQYTLVKKYLKIMKNNQTLVIESGNPLGLFESFENSPRVIITNGLMIGEFDNLDDFNRACSLGVTNYGQMTAGGWMYIGPQGIVHGTYNTLLIAGRLKLGLSSKDNLKSKLFVSSGLGGMSGAQGKAIEIAGGVGIIAEVDYSRIETRHNQKWISRVAKTPKEAFMLAEKSLNEEKADSIAYYGNVIDLLEYADKNDIHIDLLSDQTSCHAVYDGGYCPDSLSFEERTKMLDSDREEFKKRVDESLKKHFNIIKKLTSKGTYFFDYGNSFLKAIFDAGVKEVAKNNKNTYDGFIFPSYVEDILGPELFDYGYGPFRWVCLSGKDEDLLKTDKAAMEIIDPNKRYQDRDNYIWIKDADKNNLVVGSKARILYQDARGRLDIALKFNDMVRNKIISPVMLGRDHHDTGGTDSPFRETSNIKDGSNITTDMSVQCFVGNAARGMSLVTLHNGGGVGIGKVSNSGFAMLLDGSKKVDEILKRAFLWDVMGGVSRRAWARNKNSIETCVEFNENYENNHINLPYLVDDKLLDSLIDD